MAGQFEVVGVIRVIDQATRTIEGVRQRMAELAGGIKRSFFDVNDALGLSRTRIMDVGLAGRIAFGILVASAVWQAKNAIDGMIESTIDSIGLLQRLQIQYKYLIAQEFIRGEAVQVARRVAVSLTDKEAKALEKARKQYEEAQFRIQYYTQRLNELNAAKKKSESAIMMARHQLERWQQIAASSSQVISELTAKQKSTATVMETIYKNQMSVNEALAKADLIARQTIKELMKMALLSPFQAETVFQTMRMAMAFGFTLEQAKKMTKAVLDTAAALGLDNEQTYRLAYNLFQVRSASKMTALDVRQLAWLGLRMGDVFDFLNRKLKLSIKDHNDFNKALKQGQITWEQFTETFSEFARERFGKASEEMAYTIEGLRSNLKDLFLYTMPAILGPVVQDFTRVLGRLFNVFLQFYDSGVLEKIGEQIQQRLAPAIQLLNRMVDDLEKGQVPKVFQDIASEIRRVKGEIDEILPDWMNWENILRGFAIVTGANLLGFLFRLGTRLSLVGLGLSALGELAFRNRDKIEQFIRSINLDQILQQIQGFTQRAGSLWESLQPRAGEAFRGIQSTVQGAFSWLQTAFTTVQEILYRGWSSFWTSVAWEIRPKIHIILSLLADLWVRIRVDLEKVWAFLQTFFEGLGRFYQETLKGIFEAVLQIISGVLNILLDIVIFVLSVMTGHWDKAFNILTDIPAQAFRIILAVIQLGLNVVFGVFRLFLSLLGAIWRTAWNWDILNSLIRTVDNILGEIQRWFNEAFHLAYIGISGLVLWFRNDGFNKLKQAAADMWNGFWQGMQDIFFKAMDWLYGQIDNLIKGVKNRLKAWSPSQVFREIGQSVMQGFWQGMSGAAFAPAAGIGAGGGGITVTINVVGPVVRSEGDISRMAQAVSREFDRTLRFSAR